jgi:hypothetical protein
MAISKSTKNTTGATKDYRFGQKNNWRRTVWDEVLRRTNGREKTEPILYLAGSEDLDRALAIDKGVPNQNLIAIDGNSANVARVRTGQSPAVCADIVDVLWSWPENRPVAAVLLDFCSGVTFDVAGVYDAFARKPLRNAVVLVNFMRGRDAWSNQMRKLLADSGLLTPLWKRGTDGEPELVHDDTKHRGYQFLMFHALDTVMATLGKGSAGAMDTGKAECMYPELDANGNADPFFAATVSMAFAGMRPKMFSYKSGVLTFDSAVFQSLSRYVERAPAAWQSTVESEMRAFEDEYREASVSRKIAATLAVRTTRL